ncbi:MAG: hypothetical protein IVW56_09580 [Candidatus Binataceae bacterium]|nr:hypothetical protein [Candidatus Binataceae bacterium]
MTGIIGLLKDCRARLTAATKGTLGEAGAHIAAADELIAAAEAQIIGGAAAPPPRAEKRGDLLGVLRRHRAGMGREALVAALGWPPGLVVAQLNRQVKSGRVTIADGIYRVAEQPSQRNGGEQAAAAA